MRWKFRLVAVKTKDQEKAPKRHENESVGNSWSLGTNHVVAVVVVLCVSDDCGVDIIIIVVVVVVVG